MFHGLVYQVTLVPEAIHLSKAIRDLRCVERPINTPAATPEVTGSRLTVSWEREWLRVPEHQNGMHTRQGQGIQTCQGQDFLMGKSMRDAEDSPKETFVKTFQFTIEKV